MSDPNVTLNRKRYIGGSDLPNILGLNEAKGYDSVFHFAKKKMKLIPDDFKGNPFTKYGQLMEPIIREHLNAANGTNYKEETIIDEELGQRGNTDGIDRESGDYPPMIEVKTFSEEKELDVAYYEAQGQFYMERYNQPAIAFVGYPRPADFYTGVDYDLENGDEYFDLSFDPEKLVIIVVHRKPEMWAKIQERISAFQKACQELVKRPEMTIDEWNTLFYGKELVSAQNAVIQLENKLIGFKEIKKQHDEAKAQLLEQFVKYGVKTLDTGKLKITHVLSDDKETKVFDEKKFAKEHPKMYSDFKTKKKVTKGKNHLMVTVKKLGEAE